MANFKIKALQESEFSALFSLDDRELEKIGAIKMTVDKQPGFHCRISLADAAVGEEVILLPYQHHKTNSPYQASGPVFIRKNAPAANLNINEVPEMLVHRLLSIRAYDRDGLMKQAIVTEGSFLKQVLMNCFDNAEIGYIHIHNAKPGCYNCSVERA